MQEKVVSSFLFCAQDLGPACYSALASVVAGPDCISWAMHHVKKALTGAFQFAFVCLPSLLHCPRYRRMEKCITQCERVNERDGGREGESGRMSVCAVSCASMRHRKRVSDELHNHFLQAFKPSHKSPLFDPLSSLSSFFSVILKYLAKIQLCNFFPLSAIVQFCHVTLKLNRSNNVCQMLCAREKFNHFDGREYLGAHRYGTEN